jgi:hypothetical protein
MNDADDTTRTILVAEYSELNKRVKRSARRDKRAWADKLAHNAISSRSKELEGALPSYTAASREAL